MQHETKIFIPHTAERDKLRRVAFFQGQSRDRVFIIEKVDNIPFLVERIWKRHQRDTHTHARTLTRLKLMIVFFQIFDEFYFL